MVTLISVEEIQNNSKKYDIETECHNYYANGILVHNCSIALEYENGKLVQGITRGDGEYGDDITDNILKMKGAVKKLKDKEFTGTIRGEILLYKSVKEQFFPKYKNCRNAASGIMKHLDGSDCDKLNIKVYEARPKNTKFRTQVDMLDWMTKQGFDVVEYKIYDLDSMNGDKAVAIMDQVWHEERDYQIDGLVWKTSVIDYEDLETNYLPEFSIALKPKYSLAQTKILNIEWSIKNGNLTPVAIVEKVELCGATIQRANMCNIDMLEYMGIEIGHEVIITRSNEVIPCILRDVTTGISRDGYVF